MKKAFLGVVFVSLFSFVFSQEDVLGKEYGLDTSKYAKLMLLPCPQVNYMSDADQKIIQNSNLEGKDLVEELMNELYFNVQAQLLGKYEMYAIAEDSFPDHMVDLKAIMQGVNYKYATPTPLEKAKNKNHFTKMRAKVAEKLNEMKKERSATEEGELTTEYISRKKSDQFYNAVPVRKEMLEYYTKKFKTDLYLFLNQLEIKTVYGSQADRWGDRYHREVLVHFSIYDEHSELLFGDVVKIKFNSRASNKDVIVRNTFPRVGQYINEVMP